jgi:Tfp pilus assembly protein PilZ
MKCTNFLDTDATRTLITEDIVTATRPSSTVLKAYDGRPVTTLGVADVTIQPGTKTRTCTCFVVPVDQTVLFGQDVILQLELLSHNEVNRVNMVMVNPIGITVDPQAIPVAPPPRRHAFSLRNEIEAELDRLQQADVIEHVREATSWLSPLVPVRKANGILRLCVDYRRLNTAILYGNDIFAHPR